MCKHYLIYVFFLPDLVLVLLYFLIPLPYPLPQSPHFFVLFVIPQCFNNLVTYLFFLCGISISFMSNFLLSYIHLFFLFIHPFVTFSLNFYTSCHSYKYLFFSIKIDFHSYFLKVYHGKCKIENKYYLSICFHLFPQCAVTLCQL